MLWFKYESAQSISIEFSLSPLSDSVEQVNSSNLETRDFQNLEKRNRNRELQLKEREDRHA